jgi:hypothetical protein
MNEIIQWARLDDLTATVSALTWPEASYMYLERVLYHLLIAPDPDKTLRLAHFDAKTSFNFNEWERGRLFCADFELRWEKQACPDEGRDGAFQTVYVGQAIDLPAFERADELKWQESRSKSYYLWGKRVSNRDLATIGAQREADSELFVALRIPRILRYPVSPKAKYAKLLIREYLDSGEKVVYYRFEGLKEEK